MTTCRDCYSIRQDIGIGEGKVIPFMCANSLEPTEPDRVTCKNIIRRRLTQK